jgi:DNA-binding transcriptional LysR family regulator
VNLRQLEYVIAIAETGSFTGAAVRCHTAQSALSYQVASLERELGTRMFDQTSRSVRITDAGRLLLPVAPRTLRDLEAIRAELRGNGSSIRGPLRIGATQTGTRLFDLAVGSRDTRSAAWPGVLTDPWTRLGAVGRHHGGRVRRRVAAMDDGVPEGMARVHRGHAEPLAAVMPAGHPCVINETVRLSRLASVSQFIDFRARTTLWNKVQAIHDMVRLAASGAGVSIVPDAFTRDAEGGVGPPAGARAVPLAEPGSF